ETSVTTNTFLFWFYSYSIHVCNFNSVKSSFNSLFNQKFVRTRVNFKCIFTCFEVVHRFFSDYWLFDYVVQIHYARTSSILEIASLVTRSLSLFTISRTLAVVAVATLTFGRLRAESAANSLPSSRITSTFESTLSAESTFANSAVFGAANERLSTATNLSSATFAE